LVTTHESESLSEWETNCRKIEFERTKKWVKLGFKERFAICKKKQKIIRKKIELKKKADFDRETVCE